MAEITCKVCFLAFERGLTFVFHQRLMILRCRFYQVNKKAPLTHMQGLFLDQYMTVLFPADQRVTVYYIIDVDIIVPGVGNVHSATNFQCVACIVKTIITVITTIAPTVSIARVLLGMCFAVQCVLIAGTCRPRV
jgi:hypothetical protein